MRVNSMRKIMLPLTIFVILLGLLLATGCGHPGPYFPITNQFDQNVTVFLNGVKVGTLKPGQTKTFYPNEVLTTADTNLLLEAKAESGSILFSSNFTWDELSKVIEDLHGTSSYKIGNK
jgi:hypothetical protein